MIPAASNTPDVSVIVISFNDSARLARAIASVQRQTLRNIEIIVVDDASTDDTADVVARIAAHDGRIRYVCLDVNSGGCSGPRNRGIAEARAPWLMFCDSDDEYERHACKNLLLAAERSNADVVCGSAVRIDVATGKRERWRPELHEELTVADGLAEFPELLYDTISVNKIYRRSLIDEHALAFPEGLLFEDQLFTLQAMALADRVASIPEDVYYWYVDRLAEDLSITQRRKELRNVESRVQVNRLIDDFLDAPGRERIKQVKDVKFLRHDLHLYFISILESDDDTARALMQRLVPYVRECDLAAAWEIRPMSRVAVYHLLNDDLDQLRSAMRFLRWGSIVDNPIVRRGDREYWSGDQLESGPAFAGRSAAEWLDVTDLHLLAIPFSQRRYSHRVEPASLGDGRISLSGTSVDFGLDLVAGDVHATLQLLDASGSAVLETDLQVQRVGGSSIAWHADGAWRPCARKIVVDGAAGAVAIRLTGPMGANVTNVRGHAAASGDAIPLPSDVVASAGPDLLDWVTLDFGGLGWRAARSARAQEAQVRAIKRESSALSRLGHRLRESLLRPVAVRLGRWLPRARLVVVEAGGGRRPRGRLAGISQALQSDHGLTCIWVERDLALQPPDGTTTVQRGSLRHSWLLARASVRLSDTSVGHGPVGAGLTVVTGVAPQVSRVGLDDPSVLVDPAATRKAKDRLKNCDLALASGPADEASVRSAWSYAGRVERVGTPELTTGAPDLDLPGDRPVIVYAPVVRDAPSQLAFDADEWAAALGTRCYLVLCASSRSGIDVPNRLRYAIRQTSEPASDFVAAADLVIGDYGPAVPWAIALGRPLIAYLPDERLYVDRQHGLYASVRELAPTVVNMTSLIETVGDWLDHRSHQDDYDHARREYRQQWCGDVMGDAAASRAAAVIVSMAKAGRS